ncbi:MAG: cbb3-type cytochrome c oxidase subunit I [Candidatus Methanoperedens sp.]|jgi:cytochrome c oxidase cbb3-type subunit I/II|nr:cbb3-type cytochrome c oxidase subunit I [Candidatus Methanoperedens sp.]
MEWKEHSTSKNFLVSSVLWLVLFTTFGFILAIKFFAPEFLGNASFLTFGRVRPMHVNGVAFGFLSTGLLGAVHYIIPRISGTKLFNEKLGNLTVLLWDIVVIAGTVLLAFGYTQGREYAEYIWVIDVGILLTLLMIGYNLFKTILSRTERKLYVSSWYVMGTFLWFPIVYFIGNVMWHPDTGSLNGTVDAVFNWFYGHNVLGLWFTTLGIASWYYIIPVIIRRPLYSHLLSLIGFFSIAFVYTGVGGHHLLQAPIPEWLKTIAVVSSGLMMVPVLAFITNIGLTMRGSWNHFISNIPLRFILIGWFLYFLTSVQGTFQAMRGTNMFLHFSQWTVGHAHLALLGSFGLLVMGTIYFMIPRVTGKEIYSARLMSYHFWFTVLGFILFFASMTIMGLVQNSAWMQNITVAITLLQLKPFFIARAIGGGTIIVGQYIFFYNMWKTLRNSSLYHHEVQPVTSRIKKSHGKISKYKESVPLFAIGGIGLFFSMLFLVIVLPHLLMQYEPTDGIHPYSEEQAQGREIYRTMGCMYCHSQFVREQDWGIGKTSMPGDYYYDMPHFLGTERTGPDLAQIGGMRPPEWNIQHHKNPRSVSPGSIMPPFGFLSEQEFHDLEAYVNTLGGSNLETQDFQPRVPQIYAGKENPYMKTIMMANSSNESGNEYAALVKEGKVLFIQRCLSCHGGSGNGQGPYARHVNTHPANLHERISNFPSEDYHFWRVMEGVPGTAMPPWKLSLTEDAVWKINSYEMTFVNGVERVVPGEVSDNEANEFGKKGIISPIIQDEINFTEGKKIYELYCAQCHGVEGQGSGPASVYINPEPANFTETNDDFTMQGQWFWKVSEGVETTNMPPWKYVLSGEEQWKAIYYAQKQFSEPGVFEEKWRQ